LARDLQRLTPRHVNLTLSYREFQHVGQFKSSVTQNRLNRRTLDANISSTCQGCTTLASKPSFHLDWSRLQQKVFRGHNFDGAIIQDTSFVKADLYGARFQGARLVNVDFTGANLSKANFRGAIFENVKGLDLDNSKLLGLADLGGIKHSNVAYSDLSKVRKLPRDLEANFVDGAVIEKQGYDYLTLRQKGRDTREAFDAFHSGKFDWKKNGVPTVKSESRDPWRVHGSN